MKQIFFVLIVISLTGCSQKIPECEPKLVHVKTKVPKLRILYKVPSYEIKDFKVHDYTYYLVNKKELHKASGVSQKRINNILFYEKQNNEFNRRFHVK